MDSPRVAILPLSCLGTSDAACQRLRNNLAKALDGTNGIQLIAYRQVDEALIKQCGKRDNWWKCLDMDSNLFELGERLKTPVLVTGKLAALGENRRFQLRIADCQTRTVSSAVLEMSQEEDGPIVAQALVLMDRLVGKKETNPPVQLPPPTEAAWYEKWEVWAISSAVVAVVVGGILVGLYLSPKESNWDRSLVLP